MLIHDASLSRCGVNDVRAIIVKYSKFLLRHRFHMIILQNETCFFLQLFNCSIVQSFFTMCTHLYFPYMETQTVFPDLSKSMVNAAIILAAF